MTSFKRGDVVLVDYEYSDGTGRKRRPAYIISTDSFNRSRHKVIVGVITSRVDVCFAGDWILKDWKSAGLHHPSRATSVIRTADFPLVERKLGRLSEEDLRSVEAELRAVLGF